MIEPAEEPPPAEVIREGQPVPPTKPAPRPTPHSQRPSVVTRPPVAARPSPSPSPRTAPPSVPPGPAVAPELSHRDIIAIQTLLDRQNFSCNCADGTVGSRTREALRAWQEATGLPVTGKPDALSLQVLGPFGPAFTTHTVTAEECASLAPVPTTWPGRAAVAQLGYETILEMAGEKYHVSEQALRELNPGAAWPSPPAGTILTVPNPEPYKTPRAARLTIRLGEKLIRAYDDEGKVIAQFPCSIAKDKAKRPKGELTVINCAANPNYTFDPALFAEDPIARALPKKLIIPPGPNNPVGVAWISLSLPGYGIHGTPKPEDIGKTESHGCFRLANWNAEKLLKMIHVGMPVVVEE